MKYIALLRGINIGSSNRIKMTDLREILESMNFKNVKTYLQSGNVIFEYNSTDKAKIITKIENKIMDTFGFSVNVTIRTEDEFKNIVDNNPFVKKLNIDFDKLHVTFLQDCPDKNTVLNLELNKAENEEFEVRDKEIYLYLPNGYAKTKLTNNFFERKLKTIATTRNWKTTNKLQEIAKNN